MNFGDPEFLNNLKEALRNLPEGGLRWQPRPGEPPRQVDEFKITEFPEFESKTDPEDYLEWQRKIERMFEFKDLSDKKSCKYAILKLVRNAFGWFENLKERRAREDKNKISSWEDLKRELRKRYVPKSYKIDLYKKIAELTQGNLSITNYISEFEKLTLMGEIVEIEEQKMARFCRGLNRNITKVVELQPYASFDMLCTLSLKVESQLKSIVVAPELSLSGKWDGQRQEMASSITNTGTKPVPPVQGMPEVKGKERNFLKIRCFKCQGFGHFQSEYPNRRTLTLREADILRDGLQDEAPEGDEIFEFSA
ncbi:uncharacterized protein LOC141601068 [Silene latifolia]|uniref:uncharacterized protein LOC141601068 n=1 Tax=Silene latifolia TaxID=37657 RepID=UPI003D76CE10